MTRYRVNRSLSSAALYAVCFFVTLLVLVPLYISMTGGAKSMGQLLSQPLNLPMPLEISQYSDLLTGKAGGYWRALGNSGIVAGLSVLVALAVCG
ncbi:MAG TPA: hypothetical protein VMM82_02120, partial [Spirochaetia bacterium]|nr:hypothetical protein [Spirochaetia bacterium]